MLVIRYRFKTRAVFESGFRLQLEELILKLASAPSAFLKSQDAARPDPGVQITAMKATAVADLHAGGRRVFFDIAAERLLADRCEARQAWRILSH